MASPASKASNLARFETGCVIWHFSLAVAIGQADPPRIPRGQTGKQYRPITG